MDKLKKAFKKDKSPAASSQPPPQTTTQIPSSTSQAPAAASSQPAASSVRDALAKGVLMTTTYGDITIALYTDETPKVQSLIPALLTPTVQAPTNHHYPSPRPAKTLRPSPRLGSTTP